MTLDKFWSWFAGIQKTLGRAAPPGYRLAFCSETKAPDAVAPLTVYVIRSGSNQKWAQLKCPCGCGDVILLNLSQSRRPRWGVTSSLLRKATIFPSVWRTDGCRSHFFIRRGQVDWCLEALRQADARLDNHLIRPESGAEKSGFSKII